jgi:hypothetical protein
MINKKWMLVGISITIFGLLCGSISSMVSAQSTKLVSASASDSVEITIQTCGKLGTRSQVIKVSSQQAQEIQAIFEQVKTDLAKVTTKKEAIDVFDNAVIALGNYGALGTLSIKKAQRLVTGPYKTSTVHVQHQLAQPISSVAENYFCLVCGFSDNTYPMGVIGYIPFFPYIMKGYHFWPFQVLGPVVVGTSWWVNEGGSGDDPAHGFMVSFGLNGFRGRVGTFTGALRTDGYSVGPESLDCHIGMNTFSGLTLGLYDVNMCLGFTPHIALE